MIGCGKSPNDQTLTTDIQAKLYADPATKATNVSVAVKGGVATLSGDVLSPGVALEAMKIANSTPGVRKVNDQLTVNGVPDAAQASAGGASPPTAGANPSSPANPPQAQSGGSYPPLPTSTGPATPAPAQQPPPPGQMATSAPPPAPPPPQTITIPAGTHVTVRMIDAIDSANNTAGQVFRATLAEPIVSHGQVVAPRGTPVSVLLANATSAGRIKGRSELEVRLSRIELHGHSYAVDSSIYEETGKGRGQQTAARTGIGAAAGAIIGAIAGGGKGAAIGSAAGGGAGFGVNALTHGQQVRIPSETVLTFRLRRHLTITE
jgi:BON domain